LGTGQAEEDVMDASRKSELQRKLTAGEDLDTGKLIVFVIPYFCNTMYCPDIVLYLDFDTDALARQ
jgi:hypothetical protein